MNSPAIAIVGMAGRFPGARNVDEFWRNLRDGRLEPVGGSFLNHAAKTILFFERLAGPRRRVVLVKHRDRPEGSAEFRITDSGLDGGPPAA